MEYIKITKVDNVVFHKKGISHLGTLHLTSHHLIFTSKSLQREHWFPYPLISSVFKNEGSALISKDDSTVFGNNNDQQVVQWYIDKDIWNMTNIKIIGKEFTVFSFDFIYEREANDVYDTILKLTVINDVQQLYAFIYKPNQEEEKFNSWDIYSVEKELKRQGLDPTSDTCSWRISDINENYTVIPTYPDKLVVPAQVSDSLLKHAGKFRSKARIPILSYYYKKTGCAIVRSSQPLPGITKQRSIQDEKLVYSSFTCSETYSTKNEGTDHYIKHDKNLIVDARPTVNAMAQAAIGGGSEVMENYNFNNTVQRMFLGIDNIHVISDIMNTVVENLLLDTDINQSIGGPLPKKSFNWIKIIRLILLSTDKLAKSMIFNHSNILVHCSDGWDRTSQICSLVQICLDPFYRTYEGFMILIEKDWVSVGHRFQERSGHLSSEEVFHDNTVGFGTSITNNINNTGGFLFKKDESGTEKVEELIESSTSSDLIDKLSSHFNKKKNKRSMKFTSPVFQQFLDCLYQLLVQNPEKFEYNERFLRRLSYHVYSCQYGTFLFNSQKDLKEYDAQHKTRSVWDYFRAKKSIYVNKTYKPIDLEVLTSNNDSTVEDWILPDLEKIEWWSHLYGRVPAEMTTEQLTKKNIVKRDGTKNEPIGIVDSTRELFSSLNFDMFRKK